jgi:hypothetical protein
MISEPFSTEIGFTQPEALDHRPHRSVDDQDALGGKLLQAGALDLSRAGSLVH